MPIVDGATMPPETAASGPVGGRTPQLSGGAQSVADSSHCYHRCCVSHPAIQHLSIYKYLCWMNRSSAGGDG